MHNRIYIHMQCTAYNMHITHILVGSIIDNGHTATGIAIGLKTCHCIINRFNGFHSWSIYRKPFFLPNMIGMFLFMQSWDTKYLYTSGDSGYNV